MPKLILHNFSFYYSRASPSGKYEFLYNFQNCEKLLKIIYEFLQGICTYFEQNRLKCDRGCATDVTDVVRIQTYLRMDTFYKSFFWGLFKET